MTNPYQELADVIDRAAHYLPSQSPLSAFVHHNTLHVFEDESFEKAVVDGGRIYDCQPYMSEQRYQSEVESGRITLVKIDEVLIDDLGDEADRLIASLGTRYALRRAMLHHPLQTAPALELRWLMEESDALDRFREDIEQVPRRRLIAQTRQWMIEDFDGDQSHFDDDSNARLFLNQLYAQLANSHGFDSDAADQSVAYWESITLRFLWQTCQYGVRQSTKSSECSSVHGIHRHRDHLLQATGVDCDEMVHDVLIRFNATFLDQGFATWESPDVDSGFLTAFSKLHGQSAIARPAWMKSLQPELEEMRRGVIDPLELISQTLDDFGVDAEDRFDFIRKTLLSLRGWAGMFWQMEFNAPWAPRPSATGTFNEFLALKLLLDLHAARHVAKTELGISEIREIRDVVRMESPAQRTVQQQAFTLFQLAQSRFWNPEQLLSMCPEQWSQLIAEVEAFGLIERRRILHLAYEREYRDQTLDAVAAHVKSGRDDDEATGPLPAYQIACCIDDREESFRRHLEEHDPQCETFGVAGFFGVAMYYKGASDAHYTPLCPVNITPSHFVQEEPAYSLAEHSRRQALQRRTIGRATHQVHVGTRTMLGGFLAGLFGSFAAFPLVARILFPRTTAKMRSMFGSIVLPSVTQLRLERINDDPGDSNGGLGYSVAEMVDIVEGGLRMSLETERFAKLVIICGHGSTSLNNPHEAA